MHAETRNVCTHMYSDKAAETQQSRHRKEKTGLHSKVKDVLKVSGGQRSRTDQLATPLSPLQHHTYINTGPNHVCLSGKRENRQTASHIGFPSWESEGLFAACLTTCTVYLLLRLAYLRYVRHVGWVGICRLDVRRVDREDGLLCCWETALWRLRVGGRCHGRGGRSEPRVVNG